MNIAVVGGGSLCRLLLELIEKHVFQELDPNVVAVADVRNNAPGLVKAKEKRLKIRFSIIFGECEPLQDYSIGEWHGFTEAGSRKGGGHSRRCGRGKCVDRGNSFLLSNVHPEMPISGLAQ